MLENLVVVMHHSIGRLEKVEDETGISGQASSLEAINKVTKTEPSFRCRSNGSMAITSCSIRTSTTIEDDWGLSDTTQRC